MVWISQLVLLLIGSSVDAYLGFDGTLCQNKQYGANCTLECFSTSPGQSISFKGKKIVDDDTYSLSRSGRMLIALVNKLTMDTVGKYTCSASGEETKHALVTMSTKAVSPKSVYYLTIGSRSTVNTSVYGFPRPTTYTYKKNNGTGTYQTVAQYNTKTKVMEIGSGRYEINDHNAHLTITKVILSDGGDYQVSDGGTNQANFMLEVGSAPKIKTKPARSYDVVSGVATIFKCEFENLDNLTVTWIQTPKLGRTKHVTKASYGLLTLDGTNLKIIPVLANKGDSFQCVGESPFGIDKASTMISNVYLKPEIKKLTLTNKKFLLKSKENITCEAISNPEQIVTLMKKGKDGKFTELAGQIKTAGKSAYTIANVLVSDAGDYKCIAVITAKPELKDEAMVSIEVISPLVFDTSKSSWIVEYVFGKATNKVLTCIASGIPIPTVKFMKGKVELTRAVLRQEGQTMTLTAQYMANTTADAGIITCVAENKINKITHTITVAFLYKPTVVLPEPEGLPMSFTSNEVSFSWEKPANDGGSTNLEYEVKYCPQSNGAFPTALCKAVTTKKTTVTLKGLKEEIMYSFAITAKNEQGYGPSLTFRAVTGLKIGPSFGAVAAIVIADILILLLVIDAYCCHFIDRGFLYYCHERYYNGKGKAHFRSPIV